MIKVINEEVFFVSIIPHRRFTVVSYWRPEDYKEMLEYEKKAWETVMNEPKPLFVTVDDIKPVTKAQRQEMKRYFEALWKMIQPMVDDQQEKKLKFNAEAEKFLDYIKKRVNQSNPFQYGTLRQIDLDSLLSREQAGSLQGMPPQSSGETDAQRHRRQDGGLGEPSARPGLPNLRQTHHGGQRFPLPGTQRHDMCLTPKRTRSRRGCRHHGRFA